jgi:ABC-2 type transport system permease protein
MAPPTVNINQLVIRPLMMNMSVITLFILPLITMRSFADEKRSGTFELLLTSPLTNWQLILGKYFSTFVLYAVMILVTFLYQVILIFNGNPEIIPILTGYLGLLLMGSASVAIGVLISSLTENQIIAAVGTFGAMMFLWVIGWVGNFAQGASQSILQYFSIVEHFDDFAKGVLDSEHIIYYVSLAFLSLFLTYQSIESMKWRG